MKTKNCYNRHVSSWVDWIIILIAWAFWSGNVCVITNVNNFLFISKLSNFILAALQRIDRKKTDHAELNICLLKDSQTK